MLRTHDNWERLVAAVLRREEFRQLCLDDSGNSSFNSDSSNFSSTLNSPFHESLGYDQFNSSNFGVSSYIPIPMARLQNQFRSILLKSLVNSTEFINSVSSAMYVNLIFAEHEVDRISEIDLLPSDAIHDLRCIAEGMIGAGYMTECVAEYVNVRKSHVEWGFKKLGIRELGTTDVNKLEWGTVAMKVRRWIPAAKICIRVLCASEKKLCQQVFEGLKTAGDACFMDTVKDPAIKLFNFAEVISASRKSPEKLFKILDLHDALLVLQPDIEVVFDSESSEWIRNQVVAVLSSLAEAARAMLSDFENAILQEASEVPLQGGAIHPLTTYAMDYISLFSDYKPTLIQLIMSKPSTGSRSSSDLNVPEVDFSKFEGQATTAFALHLIWILATLQSNLEGKSKHHKDASLAHLFMTNNIHYIFQKVNGSRELREMIGNDYMMKLRRTIRLAATDYQRSTWVKVLSCLRDEGLDTRESSSSVSKSALRERFKAFNARFKEVHKSQAKWWVQDPQLREELRISISEKLIPAYKSFLVRFGSHIESRRHARNCIKYSVEDLENAILDFFEGYI